MTLRCDAPIAFDIFVAYWAGDLDAAANDAVEEHTMGCGACAATSARVAAITEAIRVQIPPILAPEMLGVLRARGMRIVDNPMKPGERKETVFADGVDILLHRLGGLDLSGATTVTVCVKVEETGDIISQNDDAPFDRAAGEVLIACQRHFSSFPPNIVFEVRARGALPNDAVAVYTVPHVFR